MPEFRLEPHPDVRIMEVARLSTLLHFSSLRYAVGLQAELDNVGALQVGAKEPVQALESSGKPTQILGFTTSCPAALWEMFELIRQQTKGIHRSFGSFSIYSSTRSWKLSATSSTRESVALPSYPVPVEWPAPLASKIVPGPEPPLLPTETLDGRILPDEPSTLPVPLVAAQKDGIEEDPPVER